MEVSVDPPVDDAVCEVLVEALSRPAEEACAGYGDSWRRAALEDGVSRAEDDVAYALSPRSTRGATRA